PLRVSVLATPTKSAAAPSVSCTSEHLLLLSISLACKPRRSRVPPPRFNLVRYYGVLANRHRLRERRLPAWTDREPRKLPLAGLAGDPRPILGGWLPRVRQRHAASSRAKREQERDDRRVTGRRREMARLGAGEMCGSSLRSARASLCRMNLASSSADRAADLTAPLRSGVDERHGAWTLVAILFASAGCGDPDSTATCERRAFTGACGAPQASVRIDLSATGIQPELRYRVLWDRDGEAL